MPKINSITIKILMLGGRRCGKTSVLASMKKCFDEKFGSSNFTITYNDLETMVDLTNKMEEIQNYFLEDLSKNFIPDDNPTHEIHYYDFNISLKSKSNSKIKFQFIDYPGEWIDDTEQLPKLKELVEECDVFLIAIDTPHLMEQPLSNNQDSLGRYNEARNRSSRISSLLKGYINPSNLNGKMILFVPLKCEKYKASNQMNLVKHKVKIAYREIIDHLNNQYTRIKCTIAITPIFTFGTVEFKRFERDKKSREIMVYENPKIPKYPLYGFMRNVENRHIPQYCEQPLVYILAFIFSMAKKIKESKGKIFIIDILKKCVNMFGERFLNMPSLKDYLNEIDNLKSKMVLDDGYEVITDPLKITKGGTQ